MLRSHTRVIALLAGALLLAACSDEPTAPIATESATPRFAAGGNGNGNGNGPSSLDLIEDDYEPACSTRTTPIATASTPSRARKASAEVPVERAREGRDLLDGPDGEGLVVALRRDQEGDQGPSRERLRQPEGHARDDALRSPLHDAGRLGRALPSTRIATAIRTSSTRRRRAGRRSTRARSASWDTLPQADDHLPTARWPTSFMCTSRTCRTTATASRRTSPTRR
jgi:hypothetical protein